VNWKESAAVAERRNPLTNSANGLLSTPQQLPANRKLIGYNGIRQSEGPEIFVPTK
jgi:hypothetical protein